MHKHTPLLFAVALVATVLVACHPTPSPVPPIPDVVDAGPPPAPVDADIDLDGPSDPCAFACAHQGAIGCPIAQPSPGGTSCVDVCHAHDVPGDRWDTACMEAATSCGQCGRK